MKSQERTREKLSEQVEDFFKNIINKTPKEVKRIKKKAMAKNLHLMKKREKFCKFCLTPYNGTEKVRIKNNHKIITCNKCKKDNKIKLRFLKLSN